MKTNKVNDPHPVYVSLRDWSREPAPVFAIKHENKSRQLIEIKSALHLMEEINKAKKIPTISTLPYKVVDSKCTKQVYILPH